LQGPIAGLPIKASLGAASLAYIFSTPPKPVAGNPAALLRSLLDYNFDTDAPAIYATEGAFKESSMQFLSPPNATELFPFKNRGGKMIVYHGTSDPVFSFNDTRNWYEALDKNHASAAASFVRLFPVPGMNHCQGGPATEQFDMLTALVNWVENGQAPEQVIATARTGLNPDVPVDWFSGGRPRSRPLCPYPMQVRYRGAGDINDAANFSCQI
jgi:feruloyl esterase